MSACDAVWRHQYLHEATLFVIRQVRFDPVPLLEISHLLQQSFRIVSVINN